MTFLHFKFKYSHYWCKKTFILGEIFNVTYDQQYLNKGLKTQNLEKLSLDLNLIDNVCQNIKSFCKQNCMLRIYSKPTEFTENRTEIYKNFQCAVRGRA